MTDAPQALPDDHGRLSLTITRGLPGAGKTTWAHRQLTERPHATVARCNRDDLRWMLHGARHFDAAAESVVTIAQHATIRALLQAGQSVIVDDTNLCLDNVERLAAVAHEYGADFTVVDFTRVPLETCIQRDSEREPRDQIGAEIIRDLHTLYLAGADTLNVVGDLATWRTDK